MTFLVAVLSLLSLSSSLACDGPCLVYQWGYPIWHMANLRYLQISSLLPLKLKDRMNHLGLRRAPAPPGRERLVLCNALLCGGDETINPSPTVAPNIDSIYGAGFLDIQWSWKLSFPPSGNRYVSVLFTDMYTNVVGGTNRSQTPEGGELCITPVGATPQCESGNNIFVPQYGFFIVRAYSNGQPDSEDCGDDGCSWLRGVTFTADNPPSNPSVLDVKGVYEPLMNKEDGCPYVYREAPCGKKGNKAKFWDAICRVLKESPLAADSDEAQYVEQQFGSLGIHHDGCSTLNYTYLEKAFDEGVDYFSEKITTSNSVLPPWVFLPFNGEWGLDFETRCLTSIRLHAMNPNARAVYYTAFTDSHGNSLIGSNDFDYQVTFSSQPIPINNQTGFWSLTLYDDTFYLVGELHNIHRKYAIRGHSQEAPPVIRISTNCGREENCLPAVGGEKFNLMLRGYTPEVGFQFSAPPNIRYPLPTIVKISPLKSNWRLGLGVAMFLILLAIIVYRRAIIPPQRPHDN